MREAGIAVSLAAAAVLCLGPVPVGAQEDLQAEIQQIKQKLSDMDALKAKLDEQKKHRMPTLPAGLGHLCKYRSLDGYNEMRICYARG